MREIAAAHKDRNATLIFSSGIRHGQHIVDVLKISTASSAASSPATRPTACAAILGRFRSGELKYLCNVNVLTTGFDARTSTAWRWCGRPCPRACTTRWWAGASAHPGRTDCLVLDFGGNVLRHGPVDAIRIATDDRGDGEAPAKECPNCQALIAAGYQTCPQCGHQFPEPNRQQHEAKASTEGILSGQTTREEHRVSETTYHVHYKRSDPSAPLTMRVEYRVGFNRYFREWVCFDHTGYARRRRPGGGHARSSRSRRHGGSGRDGQGRGVRPDALHHRREEGRRPVRACHAARARRQAAALDSEEGLPDRPPEPAGMTYGIPSTRSLLMSDGSSILLESARHRTGARRTMYAVIPVPARKKIPVLRGGRT